jgi:SlyX protein
MNEMQECITELEIRLTYQARLIEELNDVLTECSQRITQLERDNRTFAQTLKSLAPRLAESLDK